jgi:sugar O-acyltransferase (sialic acid O-acetyltransferase NeuD family)
MNKIILIGGGGHSASCIDVIESEKIYSISGIIDNDIPKGELIEGYPVIGNDSDLENLKINNLNFLIAIGQIKSSTVRVSAFSNLKNLGAIFPFIISPSAYFSKGASIEEGSIVMHGAVINRNASIGKNCIINSNALIEHDVQISSHCHISTGSIVNGGTAIGDGTFIGSGSVIREGISVGKNVVIGAGQVILSDIADNLTIKKSYS